MGPKKKSGGKGGKPGEEEEEDTSTADLRYSILKFSKELEAIPSKVLDKKFLEADENGEDLKEILITEKIGWNGARAISDALKHVNKGKGFKHLQSIRCWDSDLGDEGVRAFYQYIVDCNLENMKVIEYLNCGITELGCEFIARIFDPLNEANIETINLDYNEFGNRGLEELSLGLRFSKTLTYLSLSYCKIDQDGINFMKDYLSDPENCTLETLILQGNNLGNIGIQNLCQHLMTNNSLTMLNINNVQFGNDKETISQFVSLMTTNINISEYKIRYNLITTEDFKEILKAYQGEGGKHLFEIEVDERIPQDLFDAYNKAKKGRKRKTKKKPAKGKSKKKK